MIKVLDKGVIHLSKRNGETDYLAWVKIEKGFSSKVFFITLSKEGDWEGYLLYPDKSYAYNFEDKNTAIEELNGLIEKELEKSKKRYDNEIVSESVEIINK